ncbi:MAG: hypothetical protein R3247_09845, partial [Rhodothermales bacterium]|nr:hypothetical protein [Rhodothermales bacterium]
MQEGGVGVVSYRPSQVAPAVLEAADGWLLTRLLHPEEIAVVDGLLARRAFAPLDAARLSVQPVGEATLFWEGEDAAQVVDFQVARRVVPHVRHLHKYLQAPLPPEKRFYFRGNQHGRRSAASLWEFREALAEVPARTLQYHLERRDFERWLKETLHDDELARRIRKIRRRAPEQEVLPGILTAAVAGRYDELESLI